MALILGEAAYMTEQSPESIEVLMTLLEHALSKNPYVAEAWIKVADYLANGVVKAKQSPKQPLRLYTLFKHRMIRHAWYEPERLNNRESYPYIFKHFLHALSP